MFRDFNDIAPSNSKSWDFQDWSPRLWAARPRSRQTGTLQMESPSV